MNPLQIRMALLRGSLCDPMPSIRRYGQPGYRVKPQQPVHKADALAITLLSLVASGQIRPGSVLPSERRLAAAAAVSRVCVRSAAEWLRGHGYVSTAQGVETRFSDADHPAMRQLHAGQRQDLQDLAEIMAMLLPWAAGRAASQATDLAKSAIDSGQGSAEFDFVLWLAAACRSPLFAEMMHGLERPLLVLLTNTRVQVPGGALALDLGLARQAVRGAIAAGSPDQAAAAAAHYGQILQRAASGGHMPGALREIDIFDAVADLRGERVVDGIERALLALLDGDTVRSGDRMPSERDLADQFGVSRVSIRTALLRLRENGRITVDRRAGATVASVPARPDGGVVTSHQRLTDLCEIRSSLEAWAVRRACLNGDGEGIARLRRVVTETSRPNRSERHKATDDMAFHDAVARVAGSAPHQFLLESSAGVLLDYFDYSRLRLYAGRERDAEVIAHHAGIARHIERGEPDLAASFMAEHSRTFGDAFRMATRL